jgi:hypothetical protein
MSRYFAGFDAVVAAAGYNAFHELVHLGVPSLFVPMVRDTDDQAARAQWASESGAGLAVDSADAADLEDKLERLLDDSERSRLASASRRLGSANGAAEAARWLADLSRAPERPAGAPRNTGSHGSFKSFRRRWGSFIASSPRTAARLGVQQLTQPRPRTVVLALGLGDRAPEAVRDALAETPDPPERVLVVTDSLAFAELRALGVGFEHLPGPGSRQAELSGLPYEEFRRRRLALILAERPRPRRTITLP